MTDHRWSLPVSLVTRLGVTSFLFLASPAHAASAVPTDQVDSALGRILVALGILLILSQATERIVAVIRKWFSGRGADWAKPTVEPSRESADDRARRIATLNAWAVPAGLFVALLCGIDVIYYAATGEIATIWNPAAWGPGNKGLQWAGHLLGIFVAGLTASMGSSFLHDLISIIAAAKDARRKAAASLTPTTLPISAPATEDVRTLLDEDHRSIYDVDQQSLGVPLNELGQHAGRIADELRASGITGIVGVGPTYKMRHGRRTRVRGLTVSVAKKVGRPQQAIPPFVTIQWAGTEVLVPIDVDEVGTAELTSTEELRPGSEINGGTLCALVTCKQCRLDSETEPRHQERLLLGCRHVLGDPGADVTCAGEVIGTVAISCPEYDTSIASIYPEWVKRLQLTNAVSVGWTPGRFLGLNDDELYGREVYAIGRMSGIIQGELVCSHYRFIDDLRQLPTPVRRTFKAKAVVKKGDSGALAVVHEDGELRAVGMLCARNAGEKLAWFVPLKDAGDDLGIRLTSKSDMGG